MTWEIRADRPVYLQLVEQLERAIVTGAYPPGSRVPPVRELAAEAGVNPNTMQRALQALEQKGLMTVHRTAGRTVSGDSDMLRRLRADMALAQARAFCRDMARLGQTAEDAAALVRQCEEEGYFDGTDPAMQ